MLTPPNRMSEARAATLTPTASGADLASLSDLYGLPLPRFARGQDAIIRAVLRATLYSARGTYPATLATLRELYRPYEISLEGAELSADTSAALITHPDIEAGWAQRWLIWEAEGEPAALYLVQSATTGEATLERARTLHHTAPPAELSEPLTGRASLVPWRASEPTAAPGDTRAPLVDNPAALVLDTEAPRSDIPPSYYHEGDDPTETASGEPYGLQALDLFDGDPAIPSLGDQTLGPFPLYYPGAGVDSTTRALLDRLLAAGVRLIMSLNDTDSTSPF